MKHAAYVDGTSLGDVMACWRWLFAFILLLLARYLACAIWDTKAGALLCAVRTACSQVCSLRRCDCVDLSPVLTRHRER
jgi:hypothetical protein